MERNGLQMLRHRYSRSQTPTIPSRKLDLLLRITHSKEGSTREGYPRLVNMALEVYPNNISFFFSSFYTFDKTVIEEK